MMYKEDWISLLSVIGAIFLVMIICLVPLFVLAGVTANLDCQGISRLTGMETEWQIFGGCFVLVNGEWLPLDVWKSITINEGLDR